MTKNGFFGPMKGLDTAETHVESLSGGRRQASIVHEPMLGVTAEMMRWWFENIDMWTTFNGVDFNGPPVRAYRYCHPFDHVKIEWVEKVPGRDARIGPGSTIAIEEHLGGEFKMDAQAKVLRFDDEGFDFEILLGGKVSVGTIAHQWQQTIGGLAFETVATVGKDWPIIGLPASKLVRKVSFSDDLMDAWLLHNIEEGGEIEKFIPKLYSQAKGRPAS